MKVVFTNIVSLNPGDAAILQGSIEILRQAFGEAIDVTVFDRDGEAAARYYPWARFRPALFNHRSGRLYDFARRRGVLHHVERLHAARLHVGARLLMQKRRRLASLVLRRAEIDAIETYANADLVISSGGTYLVPHYNLLRPVLDYELTLELGRPLVFFPQSLGPFENSPYRHRLHHVFSRALRVVVRDERSAQNLRSVGVPDARIQVCADAAFALARAGHAPAARPHPRLRVAISVREWRHFKGGDPRSLEANYRSAIAAATTHLVRTHDAAVTFLSTCQGLPEYWTDDATFARSIVSRLDADVAARVQVDAAFRQPVEIMDALAEFDAVIATRMHAAILALCARVPVLPVAYEFKTRELFRALDMEQWVTDIDAIEPASFVDRCDGFVRSLPELRQRVQLGVEERRASALALVQTLRNDVPR